MSTGILDTHQSVSDSVIRDIIVCLQKPNHIIISMISSVSSAGFKLGSRQCDRVRIERVSSSRDRWTRVIRKKMRESVVYSYLFVRTFDFAIQI